MVNWNLMKCAFNKHKCGRMLHDDMTNPRDEIWKKASGRGKPGPEPPIPRGLPPAGEPIDSHAWLRMENDRNKKELGECIERALNALSLSDD